MTAGFIRYSGPRPWEIEEARLLRRLSYGGRKGRSAMRRLKRTEALRRRASHYLERVYPSTLRAVGVLPGSKVP